MLVKTVIYNRQNNNNAHVCLCAQNSTIAQCLCSHSRVNKWIMVHFQPCTHICYFE